MERSQTASPASKVFADKLAKYAYSSTASSSRSSPLRVKREPTETSQEARPSVPSPNTRKTRSAKVKVESDDEYQETTPTKRRKVDSPMKSGTPKKKPRPYADPEVYAHLKPVTDHLREGLNIVFCGINPGKKSSTMGHHFAHPTNKFWRSLHQSGITPHLVPPQEDHTLPDLYSCGLTNLCDRPTSEQSELSTLEMRFNVPNLTAKILTHRPRVVCFVGKKIWDIYESVVSKTASPPAPGLSRTIVKTEPKMLVKLEEEEIHELEVKEEPAPVQPGPNRGRSTGKVPMDWSQPRAYRLPHGNGQYTYFWVTPNTSGLERTPLSEQVQIFTHLNHFARSLGQGPPPGDYRDIDVDGVRQTAEAIRQAAILKGQSVSYI